MTLFQKEINSLSLLRHPNLVHYLGSERDISSRTVRVFMEYVFFTFFHTNENYRMNRYSLYYRPVCSGSVCRKKARGLDEAIIRRYTKQILHALLYLHTHHLAHRNLKCSNILQVSKTSGSSNKDVEVVLTDYGGYHQKLSDYLYLGGSLKNLNYYLPMTAPPNPAANLDAKEGVDSFSLLLFTSFFLSFFLFFFLFLSLSFSLLLSLSVKSTQLN